MIYASVARCAVHDEQMRERLRQTFSRSCLLRSQAPHNGSQRFESCKVVFPLILRRFLGSPLLLVQRGAHLHARSSREFKLPLARADVADQSWLDRT